MAFSKLPQYNTVLFSDVFTSDEDFKNELSNYPETIDGDHLTLTYLLLSARFGNTPIANRSIEQFIVKVWSVIFQYGPAWVKKLEVQQAIRDLDLDEFRDGTKAIYNHAFNPESAPSTDTLDELTYINDQNTTKYKKSKAEAYATLLELLQDDVSETYINKFKHLFKQFVMPEETLLFVSETEGEEE